MFNNTVLTTEKTEVERLKRTAALSAVDFIQNGMVVGLGTGSTAEYAVHEIARRLKEGSLKDMRFVPTSSKTESVAYELGITLTPLNEISVLDINIDGADEVDPELRLIKGGGGALLREKIVAQNSMRNIVVVDENKLSEKLGTKFFLPVEIFPFSLKSAVTFIESLNARVIPRKNSDESYYTTDQNNYILDCDFGPISDPVGLAGKLDSRAGIVEHGLFLSTTTDLIVGTASGPKHITSVR